MPKIAYYGLSIIYLVCAASLVFTPASAKESADANIPWQTWSDKAFATARSENKPVILDLQAVWCHWCHVMDKQTYANPAVSKLLRNHFINLQVDQDSRPDLSTRYQDYGWPATIVFSPKGDEIVKRAGYIAPNEMIALLKEVIKHPFKPDPSVETKAKINYANKASLSSELRKQLEKQWLDGYDAANGGWGDDHKFLDWDTVEYCLTRAQAADKPSKQMAQATLNGELKLIDPIWGGVYQYSTDGDWAHPHFEKIMQMQTENMRIFSLAYLCTQKPEYLAAAKSIETFLRTFMTSPDGVFYTSMDADLVQGKPSHDYFALNDADRRKRGIPRIDKHVYARENGWAINALASLYAASAEQKYLDQAIQSANWIIANRALPGGGFKHDAVDAAGPYLDDSLAMARAFLNLYSTTGDKQWLTRADDAAAFIDAHFKFALADGQSAGYASSDVTRQTLPRPQPLVDENVMLARLTNQLYYYTGKKAFRQMSETAMRYLATPEIASAQGMYTAGILLAEFEQSAPPAHVTIVGSKTDAAAKSLFLAALKYPSGYKIIEWWDRGEGPLPNMDIEFPELKKAAAFGCANQRCSAPVYSGEEIVPLLQGMNDAGK